MINVENAGRELKIIVRHGEENRSKVNSIYVQDDIFFQAYLRAVGAAGRIVESAEEHCRQNAGSTLLSYTNNMIIFSAERGGGKTSAMVSFGKALENIGKTEPSEEEKLYWDERILKSRFYVINSIDPTFMEESDSVLRIILSRMFAAFREQWERYRNDRKNDGMRSKKDSLMEQFQKCYKDIDILKQEANRETIYDDLYYLSDLSDSTNLQYRLYELFSQFLKFVYQNEENERQYVVIQIDDVDLNAKRAYDILEDLRRYVMLPNVIILLSADLTQLRQALENKYIKDYEKLLQYRGSMEVTQCRDMAERYIEKVFPMIQQIHLPKISASINGMKRELSIEYHRGRKEAVSIFQFQDANGGEVKDYQQVLLRLIYERTGLVIVEKEYLFELLPQKMRELTHFLEFMCSMGSFEKRFSWKYCFALYFAPEETANNRESEKHYRNLENSVRGWYENIKRLEEYFSEYWCRIYLNSEQRKVYENIRNTSASDKSRQIKILLAQYLEKHVKDAYEDFFESEGFRMIDMERKIRSLSQQEKYIEERKFFVFMSVYISLYRNEMILYDMLNHRYMEHLEDFFQGEYVDFTLNNSIKGLRGKFEINLKEFLETLEEIFQNGNTDSGISKYAKKYFIKKANEFDIFAPFTYYLRNAAQLSWKELCDDEHYNVEGIGKIFQQMESILQIVVNMELRDRIQAEFDKLSMDTQGEFMTPTKIMRSIYDIMDHCVNDITYLALQSDISSLMDDETYQNPVINAAVFCNTELKGYYLGQLKSALLEMIPETIDSIKAEDGEGTYLELLEKLSERQIPDIRTDLFGLDRAMLLNETIRELFDIWDKRSREVSDLMHVMYEAVKKQISEPDDSLESAESMRRTYNRKIDEWKSAIRYA